MAHVLQITQGVRSQLCAHITSMLRALCVRLYSKSALRRGTAAPMTVTSLTQERPENADRGGSAPHQLPKQRQQWVSCYRADMGKRVARQKCCVTLEHGYEET